MDCWKGQRFVSGWVGLIYILTILIFNLCACIVVHNLIFQCHQG